MTESTASPGAVALLWEKTGMLVVFAVLFAACSLFVEDFFSWVNVKGLALAVSQIGMVGCTMLFCLASGISICQSARWWPVRESWPRS